MEKKILFSCVHKIEIYIPLQWEVRKIKMKKLQTIKTSPPPKIIGIASA